MIIKRTPLADQPRALVQIADPWDGNVGMFSDVAYVSDFPSHSPVLGPDGRQLQYAPRPPVGFRIGDRK